MINQKSPREIELIVQDYYMNPIMCLAFGLDPYSRTDKAEGERDQEIIRNYIKRVYLSGLKENKK